MFPETGKLLIGIGEINLFSKLLIRNIIHSPVGEIYHIQKLLYTAVHVVTIHLGEELAVKNKGKYNSVERKVPSTLPGLR